MKDYNFITYGLLVFVHKKITFLLKNIDFARLTVRKHNVKNL